MRGTRGRAEVAVWSEGRLLAEFPLSWEDQFLSLLSSPDEMEPTHLRKASLLCGNPLISVLIPSKKNHVIETSKIRFDQTSGHHGPARLTHKINRNTLTWLGLLSPCPAPGFLPRGPGCWHFDPPICPGTMSGHQGGVPWGQLLWAYGVPACVPGTPTPWWAGQGGGLCARRSPSVDWELGAPGHMGRAQF